MPTNFNCNLKLELINWYLGVRAKKMYSNSDIQEIKDNIPKVSVIIPVYGVEKFLTAAIESVINQTLKDIEIILIDDGGKDKCPQIIDEYAQKDKRIIAIHKPNQGYGHSCNVGLEKATGQYIAILEPDDYIEPDMYENLYNIARVNNSDIVKSSFYEKYDTPDYKEIKEVNWNTKYKLPTETFKISEYPLFLYFHPSIWSCIYRREFLNKNKIRFIEAPGAGWTDNPFQVQTMCLAQRINYTPKAYYYWRKLNKNGTDELKNYKLPFIRIDEIHKWLDENGITDPNILSCIYKREIGYIRMISGMSRIPDTKEFLNLIKTTCERMKPDIIFNSQYVDKKEISLYKMCKNTPWLYFTRKRLKKFIKFKFDSTKRKIAN